jgi:cystathionine gamma-synthase
MTSPLGASRPLAPALYQTSVYALPDLDALDRISNREEPGYIYARDGHPNSHDLGGELTAIEGGKWGLVCSSGMASLSLAFLATTQAGDRVVASNRLYGRTNALLRDELPRFGVTTEFVDVNDLAQVETALQTPAKVLYVETISNPLLRVSDLPALGEVCRRTGTKLIVDNTFASPVLCKPLEIGADMVMESLTKIIAGHHDVTLGFLTGSDETLLPRVAQIQSIWGFAPNPFDCWLTHRSLATLSMRVHAATLNALYLARWLEEQPGIARVIYPGLGSHPDFVPVGQMLPLGAGYMLCFELEGREAVNHFMRSAPGVPFSPSLGGARTTCSHPWTTSHRYDSPESKLSQGITEGLIRLSVGIEPLEAIQAELSRGLAR